MNKTKICLVSSEFPPLDTVAAQQAWLSASTLAKCGYEVHVVASNNWRIKIRKCEIENVGNVRIAPILENFDFQDLLRIRNFARRKKLLSFNLCYAPELYSRDLAICFLPLFLRETLRERVTFVTTLFGYGEGERRSDFGAINRCFVTRRRLLSSSIARRRLMRGYELFGYASAEEFNREFLSGRNALQSLLLHSDTIVVFNESDYLTVTSGSGLSQKGVRRAPSTLLSKDVDEGEALCNGISPGSKGDSVLFSFYKDIFDNKSGD